MATSNDWRYDEIQMSWHHCEATALDSCFFSMDATANFPDVQDCAGLPQELPSVHLSSELP